MPALWFFKLIAYFPSALCS